MSVVAIFQGVAGGIYMLTVAVVGFRLLFLASRSRALPELLMGGSLLLGGVFGASLEGVGMTASSEIGGLAAGRLLLAGKIFGVASMACHCLFVWRVFRGQEAWAAFAAWTILCGIFVSFWGFYASGTFSTGRLPVGWFFTEFAFRLSASGWLVFESLRYYKLMKLRLKLGLANPVVTNRFLLWGLAALFGIGLLGTSVPPLFLDVERYQAFLHVDLIVFSLCGVAASIFYGLAFFPPASYRRHIHERAATAAEASAS